MSGSVWCLSFSGFIAFLVSLVCVSNIANAAPTDTDVLTVRIIHTNDMHSRFEETSQYSGICSEKSGQENKCYGGFARIATLVRKARNSSSKDLPTFFLNAGDTYQGTKLFRHYKWKIVSKFLNILKPDVASLGNHEFDNGVEGLVPFLNNASFPIVAANLDFSSEPSLQRIEQLKKSTILFAKNKKIGVIGYLTPDTKVLSRPGNVEFLDEVQSIKKEAKKLKSEGCNIIIALGHSGFEVDMKIGQEVDEVDLVIGGHTNTFLYNGLEPDLEKPEGLYPTVVVQSTGRKAYIVQAYAYTKYLGDLSIDFDGQGEIIRIEGNPILVDSTVPMAEDVVEELKVWTQPLMNMSMKIIGNTKVLLQGDEKICRLEECNFGNLLTDAMIYYNVKQFMGDNGWTDSGIAIYQSGGIRSSIDTVNNGKVTMDDIMTAFPFDTKVYKVNVNAKTFLEVLEWSVHDRLSQNTTSHGGGFLQFSGIQITYDVSKPFKSRVVSVKIRCSLCIVPIYKDFSMDTNYTILMPDFMYHGGDGFIMLKDQPYTNLNVTVAEIVTDYINKTSPVYTGVEGRIKFIINEHNSLQIKSEKLLPNSAASDTYKLPMIFMILNYLALMHLFTFIYN